jgi:hypothetical protein
MSRLGDISEHRLMSDEYRRIEVITGMARRMVDGGFAANYDYALETLRTRATTAGASSIPRIRYACTRSA